MKKKIYLVKYEEGSYDDWCEHIIFATSDLKKAKMYVAKFNKILKKWKKNFKQFEEKKWWGVELKKEYERMYWRHQRIAKINKCFFEEIELR